MADYFSPIDWNTPDAQKEYDKRQSINAQIDWLNKAGQAAGGNRSLQNALLGQYLNLVFPQDQQDPESQLNLAMDLISSGDESLMQTGRTMLSQSPLLKDYMGQKSDTLTPEEQILQDAFTAKTQGQFGVDVSNPEEAQRNASILGLIRENPKLARQYQVEQNDPFKNIIGTMQEYPGAVKNLNPLAAGMPYGLGALSALFGAKGTADRKSVFGL